jgi:hypothetical protein
MRRALGLGDQPTAPQYGYQPPRTSDRHAQKRRFAVDGDVQVVVLERRNQGSGVTSAPAASSPVNRLREVETALKAEQDARQRAERLLTEARMTIRDLLTKIGHADLARDEAVERANSLQSDMAVLTAALNAERDARAEAEVPLQRLSEGAEITRDRRRPMKAPVGASVAPPVKRRGRPPGSPNGVRKARAAEPKPVRWW